MEQAQLDLVPAFVVGDRPGEGEVEPEVAFLVGNDLGDVLAKADLDERAGDLIRLDAVPHQAQPPPDGVALAGRRQRLVVENPPEDIEAGRRAIRTVGEEEHGQWGLGPISSAKDAWNQESRKRTGKQAYPQEQAGAGGAVGRPLGGSWKQAAGARETGMKKKAGRVDLVVGRSS